MKWAVRPRYTHVWDFFLSNFLYKIKCLKLNIFKKTLRFLPYLALTILDSAVSPSITAMTWGHKTVTLSFRKNVKQNLNGIEHSRCGTRRFNPPEVVKAVGRVVRPLHFHFASLSSTVFAVSVIIFAVCDLTLLSHEKQQKMNWGVRPLVRLIREYCQ